MQICQDRCRTPSTEERQRERVGDKATTEARLDDPHVLIESVAFELISSGGQQNRFGDDLGTLIRELRQQLPRKY